MGLSDIFRLEESTELVGRRVYNFLIRVGIFAAAIVALGALGIVVGILVLYGAELVGLDEKTRYFLTGTSGVLYVLLVTAAFLFAVSDLIQLLWYYFSSGVGRDGKE